MQKRKFVFRSNIEASKRVHVVSRYLEVRDINRQHNLTWRRSVKLKTTTKRSPGSAVTINDCISPAPPIARVEKTNVRPQLDRVKRIWYLSPMRAAKVQASLRCSLIQAVSQKEPSERKPDPWPLWTAGHAQLKSVMTEWSKTQIRLTGLTYY